eukprot:scaffold167_cov110-Cylindrotheca_fusiformis.AAC.16
MNSTVSSHHSHRMQAYLNASAAQINQTQGHRSLIGCEVGRSQIRTIVVSTRRSIKPKATDH